MNAILSVVFILTGALAGLTRSINQHVFHDGRFEFTGTEAQVETLTRIFSYYGAVPEGDGTVVSGDGLNPTQEEIDALNQQKLNQTNDNDDDDTGPKREELDAALAALPGDQTDPDYVVNSIRTFFGDLFTADDEAKVRELVIKVEPVVTDNRTAEQIAADEAAARQAVADAVKLPLGEAIGALDPADAKHWTSNNLPALDVLEKLTGEKVTRPQVEAVAPGYTRAKAKAAKQ